MLLRLALTRILVVPAILAALGAGPAYPPDSLVALALSMSGLLLLLVAAGGRAWASIYITGKKSGTLITQGPYSIVRNPLYLFSLAGFVGAGLAFESLVLAGFFGVVFVLTHLRAIREEEARLEDLFGEEFRRYRREVPMLFPRSLRWTRAGLISVNAERLAGALRDCAAIPLVYVLAALLEWGKAAGHLPVLFTLP